MDDSIAELECKIILIADSKTYKGQVEVVLEPIQPLTQNHNVPQNTFVVGSKDGYDGMSPQFIQMMQQIPMHLQSMMQQRSRDDPRCILYIEDQIQFKARNWHHGDKIKVSFEKVSDHA